MDTKRHAPARKRPAAAQAEIKRDVKISVEWTDR